MAARKGCLNEKRERREEKGGMRDEKDLPGRGPCDVRVAWRLVATVGESSGLDLEIHA
jgi:hypothetical protein